MAIVHIVLFKFKSTADSNLVHKICVSMLALKDRCVSPSKNEPYILNSSGGRNSSTEGLSDGFTHAFVVIFASEDDREYYVNQDPAHKAFVEEMKEGVEKAMVVDYEPSAL